MLCSESSRQGRHGSPTCGGQPEASVHSCHSTVSLRPGVPMTFLPELHPGFPALVSDTLILLHLDLHHTILRLHCPLSFLHTLCLVAESCLTLCDPMDCSPPDSSVHEDSPGKTTGVGCHALLQGIFPTQGWNPDPLIAGRFFTIWATGKPICILCPLVKCQCSSELDLALFFYLPLFIPF